MGGETASIQKARRAESHRSRADAGHGATVTVMLDACKPPFEQKLRGCAPGGVHHPGTMIKIARRYRWPWRRPGRDQQGRGGARRGADRRRFDAAQPSGCLADELSGRGDFREASTKGELRASNDLLGTQRSRVGLHVVNGCVRRPGPVRRCEGGRGVGDERCVEAEVGFNTTVVSQHCSVRMPVIRISRTPCWARRCPRLVVVNELWAVFTSVGSPSSGFRSSTTRTNPFT